MSWAITSESTTNGSPSSAGTDSIRVKVPGVKAITVDDVAQS